MNAENKERRPHNGGEDTDADDGINFDEDDFDGDDNEPPTRDDDNAAPTGGTGATPTKDDDEDEILFYSDKSTKSRAKPSGPSAPPPSPLLRSSDLLGGLRTDLVNRFNTAQGGGWTGGMRTDIPLIDKHLRGFNPATVNILNAEPNCGKTTFANHLGYDVATYKEQIAAMLYLSMENPPSDLMLKHVSRLSGWPMQDLLNGLVDPDDARLQKALLELSQVPLYYLQGSLQMTPDVLIERTKEVQQEQGEGVGVLLVVDYLQLFAKCCGLGSQIDQLGMVLPQLRRVATETRASLLVIGSQNRAANTSGSVGMFGGRGSGEIEYEADSIMVLSNEPPAEDGLLARRLRIVKNRFGEKDVECTLHFLAETAHFAAY